MWQLAVLALMSSVSAPRDGAVVGGVAFGPRLILTCKWFTNFENSKFDQCRGAVGNLLQPDDGASIKCVGRTCKHLDAEGRKVAHWTKPEPLSGSFTVRLVGRLSVYPHVKQYLGDGTRTVLIEKVLSVRKAN
jgi:hypothetical protein